MRSTPLEVAPGEGPLPSYSDYSSSPFPQWPVPTWNCLPDGGRLVQKQGDTLKYWRILPTVKAVVADNCERDIETAHSLVTGLGLPDYDVRVEESLFNPFPSVCEYYRRMWLSAFIPPAFRSSAKCGFLCLCAASACAVRAAAAQQGAVDERSAEALRQRRGASNIRDR